MKSLRFMLSLLLMSMVLMSLSTVAFAQSDAQKPVAQTDAQKSVAPVPSEAQKSFASMKSLAGEWEGTVTFQDMPQVSGAKMHLSMRVTSRGNVLVHEFQEAGTPLDATKYDHPVTMFYVDGDQLTLIHYCDAGNRPRMTGTISPYTKQDKLYTHHLTGRTHTPHTH